MDTTGQPVTVIRDEFGLEVQDMFRAFLQTFSSTGDPMLTSEAGGDEMRFDYVVQARELGENERNTLYVDFDHVIQHSGELAAAIESEYYRHEPFLRKAVHEFVRQVRADAGGNAEAHQRTTEHWVSFYGMPLVSKIRDLKTDRLGRLISVSGTVTRTSEVRPELMYGQFRCLNCQTMMKDVEQQFKYTEPTKCTGCDNRTQWNLDVEGSRFVDWQKARVQENATEIPAGSMPRSLDVILRNEIVENAKAGDKVVFTGTLIVVPDVSQIARPGEHTQAVNRGGTRGSDGYGNEGVTGLRGLGVRDMGYKLAFLAVSCQTSDARFGTVNIRDDDDGDIMDQFTAEEKEDLARMKETDRLYQRLVRSIAPTVFGFEDVKKGVLLMLFGGVPKETKEGIKLRGDINVCCVGDPSTAKSQFLKYVTSFLPRAVYTSGKASSAAGLTASVSKDEDTGEFCIEAGALMLADNGICCIDEFDKMNIKDQVAIHEAMEQQTISIAKAGIRASLNARTSILAAANPIYGRYDRSKTLKQNVGLTPALMSRFDLFFVMLDEGDETSDHNIARHIVNVHQRKEEAVAVDFTTAQLQRYIKFARRLKPVITPEALDVLAEKYRDMRQNDAYGVQKTAYRMTVRQLESMIRLAEALARLHCDDQVTKLYVEEAARLLQKSILHVQTDDVMLEDFMDEIDRLSEERRMREAAEAAQAGADDAAQDGDAAAGPLPPADAAPESRILDPAAAEADAAAEASADASAAAAAARPKVPITYERYMRIQNMMIAHLRASAKREEEGMTVHDLILWYMDEDDSTYETQEAYDDHLKLVRRVITRMINVDKVLILLADGRRDEGRDERVVTVSPNYVDE